MAVVFSLDSGVQGQPRTYYDVLLLNLASTLP
jgi:hypothetical protein